MLTSSLRPHRLGLLGVRLICLIGLACLLLSALAASADVTRPPVPAAPANFTATPSGTAIALTWTAPTYASYYSLYRATASGAEGTTPYQSPLSGTSYTDTAVKSGTTYYYTLRAVNTDDVSGPATPEVHAAPAAASVLTSIVVSPASASLSLNKTQQFTAVAKDQNGTALATQPSFTWSVASGVGTVSASGLYSSGTAAGSATVKAASGTVSGTAAVTVTNAAPTVQAAAKASPNPATGTTAALSVLGADDGGEAGLRYTWATTGTPPATVTFSASGTNAAKSVTATFTKAGSYGLQVTLKDGGGLSATSSVSVTVSQTLTSIAVAPSTATLTTGGTQTFTAMAKDQFGAALATQPAFTWSVASGGVGSITSGGVYSAGSAAGSATVKATSGSVSGTAAVTVNPVAPPIVAPSLTAAATGANKITLYWNGVSGASGYNVYRSIVSGGSYTRIASSASTADPGPGMTNAFMYSDTAGLAAGTEYFYVVTAVQSGTEGPQSNEASAIPQAGAVPWDTGDPVQILNAETSQLNTVLPPDIDPNTGEFTAAQVGLLTVQGPDGVMYESADTEGDPVTAYAAPGLYDSVNNQLLLSDGETIPVPAPDTPATGINNPNAATPLIQPSALPQNFQQDFNHQFDPSLGIEREIISLPGYVGLSSTELIFPSPSTTPGNIQLNPSGLKSESDSADVYTGGFINGVYNTELDAGVVLTSSNASKDPAWQPVTFNYFDHHQLVTPGRPKTVTVNGQTLTGSERVLLYGDAVSPLQMKFVTGGANPLALQGQVALNYRGQYQKIVRNGPPDRSIISRGAKLTGWITLVAPQPQWKWKNRNSMIIKRVSSIAQNIAAKQPQQQNGSFMYGGAWGGDGSIDREGQLLKAGQGYVDWDQTLTWLAGGYPFPGKGYLYFVPQIPYHWENHINLSTSYNSLLSIY